MAGEPLEAAIRDTVAARLDQLVDELGRAGPAVQASQAFLAGLQQTVTTISTSTDAHEREAAAHQLAGSAETLGAVHLGAVAREVMRLARESPATPPSDELHDRLRATAAATTDVMSIELERIGGAS